ncbi:MAG: phosphoglucomutase/phosphomannomutase family protein [Firmicutes bacterium]|nr:phosphoglucomutase/phosphomannomutase family protein [Bacillota bacterium]
MAKMIKFGTDGWRGIMAEDFTFDNVRLVSRAIADHINDKEMAEKGIVIGYDNRFLADRFANTIADTMVESGIPVYKTETSTPTPVTAFAIKTWDTAGAVMITASHNPPEYNGLKFIPDYAGPALPHITGKIETNIKRLQGGRSGTMTVIPGKRDQEEATALAEMPVEDHTPGLTMEAVDGGIRPGIKEINPFPGYSRHMTNLIDVKAIGRAGLKLIVDPMFGCGIGYLESLLREAGAEVQEIQCRRDPLFGGNLPEPSAKLLGELKEWVLEEKADLGLALDGDADRFGLIDSDGSFITPNQFLPMLYYHLVKNRGMRGPVTRTVATTHLLDRMAGEFGEEVYETAVGFKYIGQNLLEKGCVLGGEESGGLSIKGHIPEKDGILAGLLAAEIVAVHGKGLREFLQELYQEFGSVYSNRLDVHTSPEEKERVLAEIQDFVPDRLAGVPVEKRITLDGVKTVLKDGSWVLVRPSGTEPLFRIYAEAENEGRVKELQQEMCNKLGLK